MGKNKGNNAYPKKPKKKLDSGYYHEALDRTYLVTNFVETTLAEHPVYEKHKELKEKINEIVNELATLYEVIGSLEHMKWEEEQDADPQTLKK